MLSGKVVGFSDEWFGQRKFPIDNAGFAVSVRFLKTKKEPVHEMIPYKVCNLTGAILVRMIIHQRVIII